MRPFGVRCFLHAEQHPSRKRIRPSEPADASVHFCRNQPASVPPPNFPEQEPALFNKPNYHYEKLLFFIVVGAILSSCASLNRATVISTSVPAPIRTTTSVASIEVGKNRISYTYVPTKADAKRLSEAQLLDNAIYMALQENGNADILVKVNYYITRKTFPKRIQSISLSGYPAKYVDFRQPTEADYENFEKLPQSGADVLAKTSFLGKIFNKKHKK